MIGIVQSMSRQEVLSFRETPKMTQSRFRQLLWTGCDELSEIQIEVSELMQEQLRP
jgi:hypothetical protein